MVRSINIHPPLFPRENRSQRSFSCILWLIKTNDSRCCIASGKKWLGGMFALVCLHYHFHSFSLEGSISWYWPECIVHCRGEEGDLNANATVWCILWGVKSGWGTAAARLRYFNLVYVIGLQWCPLVNVGIKILNVFQKEKIVSCLQGWMIYFLVGFWAVTQWTTWHPRCSHSKPNASKYNKHNN